MIKMNALTRKKSYLSNFLGRPTKIIIAIVILLAILFPFYWLISNSLKVEQEYFAKPPIIVPTQLTVKNYTDIFTKYQVGQGLINSILIATFTMFLSLITGSLASYALINGILPKKIKSVFALWFLIQKMYPAVVIAVPIFFVINKIGLMDTRISLIMMNTSFNLPLVILLLIGFYAEAPFEIEEQAMLDGCNLFQRFFFVTTPMIKAGLVAVSILVFLSSWNEFLFAAILTIVRAKPLTVIIAGFITDKGLIWGPMAAMGCVVIFPVLIIMWAMQKNFISGVSAGALKG
ncbi:MAG: carbohydrate ABC transporter permease [Spirochaetales bacterium]|nr:carbohydrate ABC transporter permease [Spirochaetales bacterium]